MSHIQPLHPASPPASPSRASGAPRPVITVIGSTMTTSHALWRTALRIVIPSLITIVLTISLVSIHITEKLGRLEQANPIQQALLLSTQEARQFLSNKQNQQQWSAAKTIWAEHGLDSTNLRREPKQPPPQNPSDWRKEDELAYPVETPIPNPVPADGNQTFSACLLVMDDNHRLVEWIAYHYHVLPLRYMIVAVDPRSKTSPTYIFNRWRKKGVYIEEWQDEEFWRRRTGKDDEIVDSYDLKPIPDDADLQTKRDRHRGRQKYFYRSCMMALKKAKRSWVTLLDSDEFLVYNHAGGQDYEEWENKMENLHSQSSRANKKRVKPAHTPPKTSQEGAMIDYIRDEKEAGLQYYQSPCIGVPRLQFGATESSASEQAKAVPSDASFVNPSSFDTLRWRKHAQRNDFVKNALGKVIMDVSRIKIGKSPYFESLHRPIKRICPAPWHNEWSSGLRINHYLGSWESYSFRTQDARKGMERSREQWEYKATTNADDTDDNIRPWISGFVESQGLEEAKSLLSGAGLPEWYRSKKDRNWSLLPEKLQTILSNDKTLANDNKMIKFEDWVREKYQSTRSA